MQDLESVGMEHEIKGLSASCQWFRCPRGRLIGNQGHFVRIGKAIANRMLHSVIPATPVEKALRLEHYYGVTELELLRSNREIMIKGRPHRVINRFLIPLLGHAAPSS